MLGRSIARVSRSSNPYVCLSCQTKHLSTRHQTLLYSTTTNADRDHVDLPSAVAGSSQSQSFSNRASPAAGSEKKGGRRFRKDNDFWSATLDALKRPEKKDTKANKIESNEDKHSKAAGKKSQATESSNAERQSEESKSSQAEGRKAEETANAMVEEKVLGVSKRRNRPGQQVRKRLWLKEAARKATQEMDRAKAAEAAKALSTRKKAIPSRIRRVGSGQKSDVTGDATTPAPSIDQQKTSLDQLSQNPLRRGEGRLRKRVGSAEREKKSLDTTQTVKDLVNERLREIIAKDAVAPTRKDRNIANVDGFSSLQDALKGTASRRGPVDIKRMSADELHFTPVDVEVPPVPTLAHGLDRVLFNPGVYHLQDPRSRVYNFDPYLEKIMPATEFDFDSLEKYMTSSKDQGLINMAKTLDAKFTGSTSSMSGVLTHFHYLLSQWRKLNLSMLSKEFPELTDKFSKIQRSPTAIFLRWKDGTYAIDADKEFDTPNIMSWLGQSMEKLLTNSPDKFERYRRSNPEETPADDDGKCFHYTQQGKVLMRSQLDAKDPRLPGTGIFDLKTRAVVSVRMEASEFQHRSGYQIRNLRGEWESFEREYFDMIRATMLKYSLQVRMGRMDGIFIAFHNVERIFGFQYVSKAEMDLALHGQEEACLGDQEFKLSVELLSEILEKATKKFPKQSIRLHFETRDVQVPFMYVFAEPVSEEQVEAIQNKNQKIIKEFEKSVVGIVSEEEEMQQEWGEINTRIEAELEQDQEGKAEVEDEEAPVTQPVEDVEAEEDPITDDIAETEEKVDPLANAASIVESLDASLPEPAEDTVLGLTLTVRNKVNGNYVSRPTNLSPAEEWAIEYSLSEIPAENGRAVRLLQSLKARRQKALIREAVDENANNYYSKILQDFSNKGRAWRTKMDERDAEQEKLVYTPLGMDKENVVAQMGPWLRNDEGKQDSTVPEEPEVKVENPEEYMEWLYSNMGNVKNGGA